MSASVVYRRVASGGGYWHAVPIRERTAVCGKTPSRGWSWRDGETVTCPACRRKLGMGPLPAPRAEGGGP
jgi:hypothetical protein